MALVALGISFAWCYWGTIRNLSHIWDREPDYSHGYLVIPLTLLFLWMRRGSFPNKLRPVWWGLVPIAASIALRTAGAFYALTPLDGWSIVVWSMGVALCAGGWPLLRWALPPILFLMFMVPLPYRLEFLLSVPLQVMATEVSCFILQCLRQPAFAEGTTILLGENILEVEQSCSGLRIFVGIFALASAYLIARRHEAWEAVLLIVSAIPVALLANAARIVVTALLYQNVSDDAAKRFSHDVAGWLMIPLAAVMLALVQWYLQKLMRDVNPAEIGDLLRKQQAHVSLN